VKSQQALDKRRRKKKKDDDDDDDSNEDLVVTDCSLNFYIACAASLTSYCNGMWVSGLWI
jgi:hypothetical protein